MPELPEVETVVRELRPRLIGRRFGVIAVGDKTLRRGWSADWAELLTGRRVAAVHRRGKWIILHIAPGRLLVHLGMTGQFTVGPADRPLAPHTHLIIELGRGEQLRFRDPRRFGSISHFANPADLDEFLNERVGPEPFDLEPKKWWAALAATKRPIKAVLLDQSVVAGVGNIYADESLFAARIHPGIRADQLTKGQTERLRKVLSQVLTFAIERRGSSIRDYVGGTGERGGYQSEFRVYGRTGEPCVRCRTPIECVRLAGRSTHVCPQCQRP